MIQKSIYKIYCLLLNYIKLDSKDFITEVNIVNAKFHIKNFQQQKESYTFIMVSCNN